MRFISNFYEFFSPFYPSTSHARLLRHNHNHREQEQQLKNDILMINIISIKTFFGDDESTKKVRECSMSDRMRG